MDREPHPVLDAMVMQMEGGFKSWIHEDNAWNIYQLGGLSNYSEVALLDTAERPVDTGVKDGSNPIYDVWIEYRVIQPNITLYLS